MTPQDYNLLQVLLTSLLRENQGLLILAQQQREAIRRADSAAIERITILQQAVLGRIATLEHDRNTLVNRVSRGMKRSASGAPITLRQLCQEAPQTMREGLLALAANALAAMQRVKEEHQAIGRAAAMLAGHMEGLTRQAARAMSGTGIYGYQGQVRATSMIAGFDVRM
jgi:hypothetical protein